MGLAKNRAQEKKDAVRRRRQPAQGGAVSYANVSPEAIVYATCAVAQKGGAIRLGYTRDGGAFAIGIYGDGEPYTEYVRPGEDINEYFRQLAEDFGNVTGDGSYVGP